MKTFQSQLDTLNAAGDTLFNAAIHGDWLQGRSSFGGLSTALAYAAARKTLPIDQQDRPLRSILVTFAGPIPEGDVTINTRAVRTGKSVSVVQAEMTSELGAGLILSAVFGAGRETKSIAPTPKFAPEPVDSTPDTPFVKGLMPGFLAGFRLRWTGGGVPSSAQDATRLGMWVRHGETNAQSAAEELIAIGDVPPPIMMSHYNRPINASSLTWCLEFLEQPGSVETDWYYLDFDLEAARDGYSQQAGRIFAQDGTLMALSHQCMTFFE